MISSHFHRSNDFVEHHRINYEDNLYYMDNQPYPYLDSIILYHQRHKLNGIKLTYHVCYRLWKGFVYNLMNALFCLHHSVFPMQCFDKILLFTWSGSNVSTDVPSLVRTGDLKFRKETNKYKNLKIIFPGPFECSYCKSIHDQSDASQRQRVTYRQWGTTRYTPQFSAYRQHRTHQWWRHH